MPKIRTLEFYIGPAGGAIPLLTMIILMLLLTISGKGGASASWAPAFIGIICGLLLVKNKTKYCESLMRGVCNKSGIVIIIAWIFASVLGKIMVAGGLVNGIMWLGTTTGLTGAYYVVMVFFSAALFAVGTGSSNGSALALSPVLFPAGYFLGADPIFIALAIMSGGAFGDNIAPISDTTIVSAYTQGAKMKDVVKSRLPLALAAAVFAIIIFLIFGNGEHNIVTAHINAPKDPHDLWLLLALVIVIISALTGRHIIESLIYGILSASFIGILNGRFTVFDLFKIPAIRGDSNGIIQSGVQGVVGAVLFIVLIMAVIQIFIDSGLLKKVLNFLQHKLAKSVRQAESVIVSASIASSLMVSSNGAAELLVGPTIVKPLGESFNLAPSRRANLMDCAVCSVFYMMPWSLAVMVWYDSIENAAHAFNIPVPSALISFIAPYPWALFLVLIFSIITGWNRKLITKT